MKVVVDYDLCQSHGQCEFAAPEVFTVDDDGDLQVLQPEPPQSAWADVEQAVRSCPSGALSIED